VNRTPCHHGPPPTRRCVECELNTVKAEAKALREALARAAGRGGPPGWPSREKQYGDALDWIEVRRFAQAMEAELRANAHKGGWSTCSTGYLLRRLGQEVGELRRALNSRASRETVLSEAADVANFAMMIADVYEPEPR
jgi:NTP pyrophosphatase (non-canonical NTP hydrolase)